MQDFIQSGGRDKVQQGLKPLPSTLAFFGATEVVP
jgi:hypothetical protein